MKIYSQKHFENMQMMCRYFETNSKINELYFPEFITSYSINDIIEKEQNNSKGVQKILKLLAEIENIEHKNDMHWLDYKIHVMAVLRHNEFSKM